MFGGGFGWYKGLSFSEDMQLTNKFLKELLKLQYYHYNTWNNIYDLEIENAVRLSCSDE